MSPYLEDDELLELRSIPIEDRDDETGVTLEEVTKEILLSTQTIPEPSTYHGPFISTDIFLLSNLGPVCPLKT